MKQLRLIPLLLLVMWLAGCVLQPTKEVTPPDTRAVKVKPPEQPPSRQKQALPPPPPPVAILVSSQLPPYTEVANRLKQQLGNRATVYPLPKPAAERQELMDKLAANEHTQLVTIGLDASLLGKRLPQHNKVFCQVFNYTQYELSGPRSKGVSMLPGVEKTLATWKKLSPSLHDIGIISGTGLQDMLDRISTLAGEQGITAHIVEVDNDKEYQYAYKQLSDKVQGYWLIPDNRVLSISTLKEIMTFSVRNSKQVVVFNEELLRLGGMFSASPVYDDIAGKVMQRLEQSAYSKHIPGIDLLPLDKIELGINPVMVQRLGLNLPGEYREVSSERTTR